MLRALWSPRLMEAIDWIAELERDQSRRGPAGRSKAEVKGEAALAGVTVHGRVDRIDRLADGGLAIVDYKTGKPPQKAVDAGFALQLGLLGLIGRAGGFEASAATRGLRILVAGRVSRQFRPAACVPTRTWSRGIPRPCLRATSRKPRRNG